MPIKRCHRRDQIGRADGEEITEDGLYEDLPEHRRPSYIQDRAVSSSTTADDSTTTQETVVTVELSSTDVLEVLEKNDVAAVREAVVDALLKQAFGED